MKRRNNNLSVAPLFLFFFSGFLLNGLVSLSFFEDKPLILDDVSVRYFSFKKTYLEKNKKRARAKSSSDVKATASHQKQNEKSLNAAGETAVSQLDSYPDAISSDPLPRSFDRSWSLDIEVESTPIVSRHKVRFLHCLYEYGYKPSNGRMYNIDINLFLHNGGHALKKESYAKADHPDLQKAADCMLGVFKHVTFRPTDSSPIYHYIFASINVKQHLSD